MITTQKRMDYIEKTYKKLNAPVNGVCSECKERTKLTCCVTYETYFTKQKEHLLRRWVETLCEKCAILRAL